MPFSHSVLKSTKMLSLRFVLSPPSHVLYDLPHEIVTLVWLAVIVRLKNMDPVKLVSKIVNQKH